MKKNKVIPIADGRAHLLDKINADNCVFCGKKRDNDNMILMRVKDKDMVLACLHHKGVVQEFIKQYNTLPIGWGKDDSHARQGNNKKD